MRYEGTVYRPPSEAHSLILQATIGCSHNACTFCIMYKDKKYRERSLEEIEADIGAAAQLYPHARRVFLADGNALALPTAHLTAVLEMLKTRFPRLERIGIYAGPQDILGKDPAELKALRKAGLGIVYLGVESGSDRVLRQVNKGADREEMVRAGKRVRRAGLTLSVTVILGLGGKEASLEHARETARVINEIDPEYLAPLTLLIDPHAPLARKVERGEFTPLTPLEVLAEMRELVTGLELSNCVFRSNHASNYLPVKGTLPQDKERMLREITHVLAVRDRGVLRPESWRGF